MESPFGRAYEKTVDVEEDAESRDAESKDAESTPEAPQTRYLAFI